MRNKALAVLISAAFFCACAANTVISPSYNFTSVKRIGVMAFDSPWNSLKGAENSFAKYFMQNGFQIVERAGLEEVLSEHNISVSGYLSPETTKMIGKVLGVDVLLMGEVTSYMPERKELTMATTRSTKTEPVYSTQRMTMPDGTTREYISQTGNKVTRQADRTPQEVTINAQVGVVAKLVDVETAEIVWIGTASGSSYSSMQAIDNVAKDMVKSFAKELKKREKAQRKNNG